MFPFTQVQPAAVYSVFCVFFFTPQCRFQGLKRLFSLEQETETNSSLPPLLSLHVLAKKTETNKHLNWIPEAQRNKQTNNKTRHPSAGLRQSVKRWRVRHRFVPRSFVRRERRADESAAGI